ncbi:MAG: putative TetR family transcriptional regulator [Solirubrobacterales bacterium]|nr:putative TetR family transcriptional regulator [Solirubrobacterales bacterium]
MPYSALTDAPTPEVSLAEPRRFSARQEEVLDIVEAVFLREGVRAVRIGRLAAEARCSRSTLYELAPSKEELLLIVLDRMMHRIMSRGVQAIRRETDPVEQIRAMLTSGALDFAPLGPRFMDAVRDYPPARLLFDRRIADSRDAFERLIREGAEHGHYQSVHPRVVAEAIFVVVLRFTEPEFVRSAGVSSSVALRECVDLLVDGLRPR